MGGPQGKDMAEARCGPMHAGSLEALGDAGFTGGFGHARTDEEALVSEGAVAHPGMALRALTDRLDQAGRRLARLVAPVPPTLRLDPGDSAALTPLRDFSLDDDGDLPHLRQKILASRRRIGFRIHSLYG